jgi:hypothetical protein
MAKLQRRPLAPPLESDKLFRDYTSVLQSNLEDLFNDSHVHSVRTTEPLVTEGNIGDIFLVEISGQTFLYTKFPNPTRWERTPLIPSSGGWDDIRTPGTSVRNGTSAPALATFAGSGSLYIPVFSGTGPTEEVYFSIQMPHTWKEGTAVYPHVHWSPVTSGAGNVKWNLEYTLANVNETFPSTTTLSLIQATSGTAWKHQVQGFGAVDMTGKKISCMFHCRLYRNSGDAQDTYTGNAAFLEFDFHYQIDAVGSEQQFVK